MSIIHGIKKPQVGRLLPRFFLLLLLPEMSSCIHFVDNGFGSVLDAALNTMWTLASAAHQYRQVNGVWPTEPIQLQPFITDPKFPLDRIQKLVGFRESADDLEVLNRQTGELVMTISSKNSKSHPTTQPNENALR